MKKQQSTSSGPSHSGLAPSSSFSFEGQRAARNMPLIDALEMGKLGNALIAASGRMEEAMQGFADSKGD